MIIEINSVNRTTHIEQSSVRYIQTLNKQPGLFTFSMIAGTKTIPTMGQSVVFKLNDVDAYFSGTITDRKESTVGSKVLVYDFICMDGYYDLDRKLVIKAYSDTTAGAVVADIISTFTTGFTFTPPAASPTVKTARFNYIEPSLCIKKIADEIGWDWYIDAANEVHFFPPGTMVAASEVNDTDGCLISGSLNFDSNLIELKNVVYIRGGEYEQEILEGDAVDQYEANGVDNTFPLVYRYSNVNVTVDAVVQTVGIDFIDAAVDFDCLYNFQEKMVKFPDGTLAAAEVVRVFGDAKIPLIVQATDDASITAYGRREHIELDKSIESIEEAEQLALALIDQWMSGSKEGSFRTYDTTFVVGQQVVINSATFGVNETYKVNRVIGSMHGSENFSFAIDFIKSGQTTFDDIMVGLLQRDKNNITIADNEVLQRLLGIGDSFSMTDEIVSVTSKTGPYYYATATGGNEEAIWGFSTW